MLDGQVLSAEDYHDGGLRAERVARERAVSLSFSDTSLVEEDESAKSEDILIETLFHS